MHQLRKQLALLEKIHCSVTCHYLCSTHMNYKAHTQEGYGRTQLSPQLQEGIFTWKLLKGRLATYSTLNKQHKIFYWNIRQSLLLQSWIFGKTLCAYPDRNKLQDLHHLDDQFGDNTPDSNLRNKCLAQRLRSMGQHLNWSNNIQVLLLKANALHNHQICVISWLWQYHQTFGPIHDSSQKKVDFFQWSRENHKVQLNKKPSESKA